MSVDPFSMRKEHLSGSAYLRSQAREEITRMEQPSGSGPVRDGILSIEDTQRRLRDLGDQCT